MSLRAKVLLLFLTLAVAPLLVVAVFDYLQSVQALDNLVLAQDRSIAELAARELDRLYSRRVEDLRAIAADPKLRQVFGHEQAAPGLDAEWVQAVAAFSPWVRSAELRDNAGQVMAHYGTVQGQSGQGPLCTSPLEGSVHMETPVGGKGVARGMLVAEVRPDVVFPIEALAARVGSRGFVAVVDRTWQRVVYQSQCSDAVVPAATLFGGSQSAGRGIDYSKAGFYPYRGGTVAVVPLSVPAWSVVASVDPAEFLVPFKRSRAIFVMLVLFVAGATSVAFGLLLGRMTESLNDLTEAADEVGRGNYTPSLPPPGPDEVGRLAYAFGMMADKIQETLRQIESTRQLATMGEFAAKVSHEIRNPLSSIRLNLQGIEREVRKGRVPEDLAEPVQTCLQEVDRLNGVVSGILGLARQQPLRQRRCSLHGVGDGAVALLESQLKARGVEIRRSWKAARDDVIGDEGQLRAALINLLLNAADAMPGGGGVHLWTESGWDEERSMDVVRLHVADEGPGVGLELHDEIFRPFATTKPNGTGLGLPVARRTAEQHGGALYLAHRSALERGADFVLLLPLAAAAGHAAARSAPVNDAGAVAGRDRAGAAAGGSHHESGTVIA
jgi:signal transduction histidine kinase